MASYWDVRLAALISGVFFAYAAYSIMRKDPKFWKRGWWVLSIAFGSSAAGSALSLSRQHIDSTGMVVFIASTAIVTGAWVYWWQRQRRYFEKVQASASTPHPP